MCLFWSGHDVLLCFISLSCDTTPATILTISSSFVDCFKLVLSGSSDSLPFTAFGKKIFQFWHVLCCV